MKNFVMVMFLLLLITGCTLDNRGSQAMTFNPFNFFSGEAWLSPANGDGFVNGESMKER